MKRITKIENKKQIGKLRVAAYCRVSTDSNEQLLSLEAQKQHYKEYINSHDDWTYAGIYYDEGISGTKKDIRPALMQMIADCESGKIDFIVTKSISRFARNTTDCLELVRRLSKEGIHIFFEKENINTMDMEGELMLTILSSLAEEESVSISQNARWSVQKRFQNGSFIIGYPPYGYRNNDGAMEIIPEEAEVVKEIFAAFLAGSSAETIAKDLNSRGIKTRRNKTWVDSTIRGMLKNEKYTGDAIFQKTWTDDSFNRHKNHGEADRYVVKDHHEPIISREDFEAAQALVHRRFSEKGGETGTGKYHKRYALSGKIRCGECGGPFTRKIYKRGGQRYVVWACRKHIKDKTACTMKAIEQDAVEAAFMTMMNKLAFARDVLLKPLLEDISGADDGEESIGCIRDLEQKIDQNIQQRERLHTMLTQGLLDTEIFNEENNILLSEHGKLETEILELRSRASSMLQRRDELKKLIKALVPEEMRTEYDEELLVSTVDHITIRSQAELEFTLKCGLCLREEIQK